MKKEDKLKKILTGIIGNDPDLDYFVDFLEMLSNPKYSLMTDENGDFYFVLRDKNDHTDPRKITRNLWKEQKVDKSELTKEMMEKVLLEGK